MLINGLPNTQLSVLDRGLQYGDGLFETLPVIGGRPLHLQRHLERLLQGCRRLVMTPPDPDLLLSECREQSAGIAQGVLKIILTRGAGGRGYNPANASGPTRIVYTAPWPDYPAEYARKGIQARLCETRLGWNRQLAGIKHLNRLEQVLARAEWSDRGIAEGVMLDSADNVVEGTMSNIFLHLGDRLVTPLLDRCGVAGIMRRLVMERASALGIDVQEDRVGLDDLKRADGVFFTNSLIGIWPLRSFNGVEYPIDMIDQRLMEVIRQEAVDSV